MDLDNLDKIRELDKSNMAGSIEMLGEQIQQTWDEVNKLSIPENYKQVNKIVFSGMGGSSLGAYVAKNLYTTKIKQSFEIVNDYNLPGYVDENTLVVVGSYSGTTEETVSGLNEAISKKAKVVAISTGGKLEQITQENNIPFYGMNPKFNPSNQPRMGIGYSVFALLTILTKLEIISINNKDITYIKEILTRNTQEYGIRVKMADNLAKQIAKKILGKVPIFIAGEFLIGAIHAVRNQLNENAKAIAVYFPLPELNHHLLEALQFPKGITNIDYYIFFHSHLYSERIAKRSRVTKDVIEQNGHKTVTYKPTAESPLAQTMESINFGSYIGYYLALLNEIDPSPIVWVEEFKKKLAS
jgi:glucose/mannose-6-phosphate isomerase